MPLQKNQVLTLQVERLSSDGSGVAHSPEGETVFIPGAAPGDEARVRIVKDCKRYAFCILDEVEAALDEVNVFRFGEYIKRFCGDTQFILITHRRGTMQIADRLYGVTMPERGVSKVIGVDIAEIDAKKNELTDTE